MLVKGNIEEIIVTEALLYTAEYNGFTGIGATPEEAKIALNWACGHLPLDGQRITTVTYSEMIRNSWN